ncbi:MAG: hypothetical protein KGS72_24215 [Cyanobacteria bacterium REEB67]|nr:hypothetical protein [Cyanobacteria bacterium REEB67]
MAININANNETNLGRSLAQTVKGQVFKIQADGNTGSGAQNASWVQLSANHVASPSSPMDTTDSLATQWASQSNSGIMTALDGINFLYVSGASNNKSTGQFQNGNGSDQGGSTSGTPQMRLY